MGCCCHVLKQNKSQLWSSKQIGHLCQNVPTSTIGHRHLCKAALATAVVAYLTPILHLCDGYVKYGKVAIRSNLRSPLPAND